MAGHNAQRTVRLSVSLARQAERRAKKLGKRFPEYVRYLITRDLEESERLRITDGGNDGNENRET